MDIIELKDNLKQKALSVAGINSFQFDDLSAITNQDIDLNLLFLQLPSSVINDFSKPFEVWNIDFWVFKLDKQFNSDEAIVAWKETQDQAIEFIKEIVKIPKEMTLADKIVNITRGHVMQPDNLIGVRCTFLLRVGNCI